LCGGIAKSDNLAKIISNYTINRKKKDGLAGIIASRRKSRSRAYRWGEDGIAGLADDKQRLCFALALWSGQVNTRVWIWPKGIKSLGPMVA
jgi:hypothetical protein